MRDEAPGMVEFAGGILEAEQYLAIGEVGAGEQAKGGDTRPGGVDGPPDVRLDLLGGKQCPVWQKSGGEE